MIQPLQVPKPYAPAGNPIDVVIGSNMLPIGASQKPVYDVYMITIDASSDLCEKTLTINGDVYLFTRLYTDDYAPFTIPLNYLDALCSQIAGFTYCEIADLIVSAINDNPNVTDYLALPINESVKICGNTTATSVCNEITPPYVTIFIIAKKTGIDLQVSTNSSDIGISHICIGAAPADTYNPYAVTVQVEVEKKEHGTEIYTRLPIYENTNANLNEKTNLYVPDEGFDTSDNNILYPFFFNIQSACNAFFKEDLPALDNQVRQCLNTVRYAKISIGELYNGQYSRLRPINSYVTAGLANRFSILNASLSYYRSSFYKKKAMNPTLYPSDALPCIDEYNYPYPLEPYFEGIVKFLHVQQEKTTFIGAWEWLYFYNATNNRNNLELVAECTYNDGTTTTITSTAIDFAGMQDSCNVYESKHQIYQLPIHNLWSEIPNIDNLKSFCVYIRGYYGEYPTSEKVQITTKFSYTIENTCGGDDNITLLYQNDFGVFETIHLKLQESGIDSEKSQLETYTNASEKRFTKIFQTANETFKANSGTNNADKVAELLLSPSVYMIEKKTTESPCGCGVTDCETFARTALQMLSEIAQNYFIENLIFPCTETAYQEFINPLVYDYIFSNNQCYDVAIQCLTQNGVSYTRIKFTPLNSENRAYFFEAKYDGTLSIVYYESDDAGELTFPVFPVPPAPSRWHFPYRDLERTCTETTESIEAVVVQSSSTTLDKIDEAFPDVEIALKKEQRNTLQGGILYE